DRELIRRELRTIEAFGEFNQGRVAARIDRIENVSRAFFDGFVEEAGRAGDALRSRGEISVRVAEDVHGAVTLEERTGKVKTRRLCANRRSREPTGGDKSVAESWGVCGSNQTCILSALRKV